MKYILVVPFFKIIPYKIKVKSLDLYTTKNIIKTFELEDLIYKSKPSFEFYDKYTKALDVMKSNVDKSLSPDNVGFTAFLKVAMESYGDFK